MLLRPQPRRINPPPCVYPGLDHLDPYTSEGLLAECESRFSLNAWGILSPTFVVGRLWACCVPSELRFNSGLFIPCWWVLRRSRANIPRATQGFNYEQQPFYMRRLFFQSVCVCRPLCLPSCVFVCVWLIPKCSYSSSEALEEAECTTERLLCDYSEAASAPFPEML